MDYSTGNTLSHNQAIMNTWYGYYLTASDGNSFLFNSAAGNDHGIYLSYSDINLLAGNTLSMNTGYGIRLYYSLANTVYHNNLLDNAVQAYDNDNNRTNAWHNAYPSGGNYWNDYMGTDALSGPDQVAPTADGIGDQPFSAIAGAAEAEDRYPLMEPFVDQIRLDTLAPVIADQSPLGGTTGEKFEILVSVTDDLALSYARITYWFGQGSETVADMSRLNSTHFTANVTFPRESLEPLHYRITASDMARNWNTTPVVNVIVADNDNPVADAGQFQSVISGAPIRFNGTCSRDNIGVANFTWVVTYNGSAVLLYGSSPQFVFWTAGNYSATLTVSDAAGNRATAQVAVLVTEVPEEAHASIALVAIIAMLAFSLTISYAIYRAMLKK
jgi:parallel beta-helix repeat protein